MGWTVGLLVVDQDTTCIVVLRTIAITPNERASGGGVDEYRYRRSWSGAVTSNVPATLDSGSDVEEMQVHRTNVATTKSHARATLTDLRVERD